ncbi:unnamed protein product [Ostreobium quekettii]|uniref:Actin-related protein 3 n=1 Tax=Ostreobium quekettii TaxID=121088 RepID=A0A8S1IVM2_9CHLO|nr:unnamed protein product [Ostreobium quekettii]|eukprot:evm.model.scf_659EXC.3 EVM.evm.TU.scf_659EXC.3   scf_659EXC:58885-64815(+)
MFETFNVSGLFIGVQAVLALYASLMAADATSEARINPAGGLTGTVVDVGDGVTHVIPIVDSYVIASSIKSIPIAGRDVSAFVQQLIRDRGESVPADMALEVAKAAKEKYCYVCPDVSKEFVRFDADRARAVKQYKGINNRTGQEFMCDIGPERFLGPEIFFTPEMYNSNHSRSLPCVVDDVIQLCPIDTKRALYRNIVLSGGSTMFKGFGRRLGRDLRARVNSRLADNVQPVDVHVLSHPFQRYAVWLGGSLLATRDEFRLACKSREDYQEHGPSICRTNYVFRDV